MIDEQRDLLRVNDLARLATGLSGTTDEKEKWLKDAAGIDPDEHEKFVFEQLDTILGLVKRELLEVRGRDSETVADALLALFTKIALTAANTNFRLGWECREQHGNLEDYTGVPPQEGK